MSLKDLKKAYVTLWNKGLLYSTLFNYYDGDQPLTYTATRLREIFKDLDAYFAENWCSVVIDSAKDRVNLQQIQITDKTAANAWAEMWARSEMALESDEVHEAAMVTGEAYMIAWPNDEDETEAYANDPRLAHICYDAEYPRKKKFAAKWWVDQDGKRCMTLYYPDHLEYYRSKSLAKYLSENGWQQMDPLKKAGEENPYGEIPVFHFRIAHRKTKSDLKNVVPIQNAVNKLLTDMMVTAEYAAFPQRYVISNAEVKGKLKNAPNEVWDIPGGDGMGQQSQAGQFAAAALDNYLKAIDDLATAISSITRTPKHYFFSIGSNLSGEALIAMEAPLNKKAQDRIDRFTPPWQALAQFMLKVEGLDVDGTKIMPIFDKPETIQPRTQAETRQMNRNAGMPLRSILRDEGKTDEYIAQVMKDLQEEKTQGANLAQAYLDQARKNFDQGNNGPGSGSGNGSTDGKRISAGTNGGTSGAA